MGVLEVQVLHSDASARAMLEIGADARVCVRNETLIHLRPSVASSLEEVAALTPLLISFDHLLAVPHDSALGEESFETVLHHDAEIDSVELRAGELLFAALVPRDASWPHVMVHRALPRQHPFATALSARMERALLVALRDAIRHLQVHSPRS